MTVRLPDTPLSENLRPAPDNRPEGVDLAEKAAPVADHAALIDDVATQICAEHTMPGWQLGDSHAVQLPSVPEVLRILECLDAIFFPCYRSKPCHCNKEAEQVVRTNLKWLNEALTAQVERALPFRWLGEHARSHSAPALSDIKHEADYVVSRFLDAIPQIRHRLMLDVDAAYCGDPAALSYAEVILSYPGLRAITAHRIAHELYRLDVPLLPRIMSEQIHSLTGIDIHPGAEIGDSFFIDHGTGVVIGETTSIGNRVKLYQGVTLGARSFPTDEDGNLVKGSRRHPTIGNGVVIYAHATVLGGQVFIEEHCEIGAGATIMQPGNRAEIRIGHHSILGGNVWLTESVEPHSFVFQEHHQLVRVTTRGSHR